MTTHSRQLDLRLDRMIHIRVDSTQHRPVDTATGSATVEECRSGAVYRQVPRRQLYTKVRPGLFE